MNVEITNTMSEMATHGIDAYQPVFRGQLLEIEASLPEVSLRNLRALLKAGLEVATMLVVENGNILVVFNHGETYLATGFAVGQVSDLTKFFAQFASEALPNSDQFGWESYFAYQHDPDHRGLIDLTNPPKPTHDDRNVGPRVFTGDE